MPPATAGTRRRASSDSPLRSSRLARFLSDSQGEHYPASEKDDGSGLDSNNVPSDAHVLGLRVCMSIRNEVGKFRVALLKSGFRAIRLGENKLVPNVSKRHNFVAGMILVEVKVIMLAGLHNV